MFIQNKFQNSELWHDDLGTLERGHCLFDFELKCFSGPNFLKLLKLIDVIQNGTCFHPTDTLEWSGGPFNPFVGSLPCVFALVESPARCERRLRRASIRLGRRSFACHHLLGIGKKGHEHKLLATFETVRSGFVELLDSQIRLGSCLRALAVPKLRTPALLNVPNYG